MKTLALFIPFGIAVFLLGCVVGYMLHPEPLWDIGEDDRGCTIYWDDGTVDFKFPTIHQGESIKIRPFDKQKITRQRMAET